MISVCSGEWFLINFVSTIYRYIYIFFYENNFVLYEIEQVSFVLYEVELVDSVPCEIVPVLVFMVLMVLIFKCLFQARHLSEPVQLKVSSVVSSDLIREEKPPVAKK